MPSKTLSRAYIDAFKSRWPCHGLPDKLHSITFAFDANGDLVDVQASTKGGKRLDTYDFDGPALLALSQDAQEELRIDEMLAVYGRDLAISARVELSPATDRWIRGDRFGLIVGERKRHGRTVYRVCYDRSRQYGWHQALDLKLERKTQMTTKPENHMLYPVNYRYSHLDGGVHEGFASTEAEAVQTVRSHRDGDTIVESARLETAECGVTCSTREEFERHWKAEIDAGWVMSIHVYGGFKGEATFWAVRERERQEYMAIHVSYELDIRQIPREAVEDCTVGGRDASEPVACWIDRLGFTVDQARARKCLKGYGAWDDLDAIDDATVCQRVFWLACGDFAQYAHEAREAGFDPWEEDRPGDFEPSCGSDSFILE